MVKMYRCTIGEKISLLKKKRDELIKNIKSGEETFIGDDKLVYQTEAILATMARLFSSICAMLTINQTGRIPRHGFECLEMLVKSGYISTRHGNDLSKLLRFLNFYYDFASMKGEDVYRIAKNIVSIIEEFIKEIEEL